MITTKPIDNTNAEFIEAENIFNNLLKNKRKFTHLDL